MSHTPDHNNNTPFDEFTPIGSKSGGFIETTNHSYTNLSPILKGSDKSTTNIRNNERLASGNGTVDSTRRLNSTNFILHRINPLQKSKSNMNNNHYDDVDLLHSSSVASSVWEDDIEIGNVKENKAANMNSTHLFGRNNRSNKTSNIINLDNELKHDIEINPDSNMLKLQYDLVKKLQSENTNLRVQVMTLRQHLTGLPTNSVNLIEQNVALNQQVIKLTEMLKEREASDSNDNDTVGDDANDYTHDYKEQLKELNETYQNVINEKELLLNKNIEKDSDIEKLRDECNGYESEIFNLKLKLDEFDDSSSSDKIHQLEDKIEVLEETNYNYQKEIEDLSRTLDNLENDNILLKEELRDYESKDNEKSGAFDNNEIIDELKTEINDLKIDIKTLENDKKSLQKKYDEDTRMNYHSSRDKIGEMTQRLEEATKTIDMLDRNLSIKDKEEIDLTKNIKQLNLKIDSLQNRNQSLQDKLDKLKGSNSSATELLTKEIDELYNKIEDYENEIGELQDTIQELEGKYNDEYINDLEDDKNKLYDSLLEVQELIKLKDEEITKLKEEQRDDNDVIEIEELIKLKGKVENEREQNQSKINKLIIDKETIENSLLTKLENSENSRSKIIEIYEELQSKYDLLESEYQGLLNSRDVEDLSNDLAKITIEYKKTKDENFELINRYSNEISMLNNMIELKDLELENAKSGSINTLSLNSKLSILQSNIKELNETKYKLEKEKKLLEDENYELKLKNKEEVTKITKTLEYEKSLLRLELKEKKSMINNLVHEKDKLQDLIDNLSKDQDKLISKSTKLSEKVKVNDISQLSKLKETELKLTNMTRQYEDMVSQYNYMKDDLIERLKDMKTLVKNQGKSNSEELNEWREKYEQSSNKLKANERSLNVLKNDIRSLTDELEYERNNHRDQWFPPTPQSPREDTQLIRKLEILKNQKELLILKLKDSNKKLSDLRYMINYFKIELNKKNEMYERNRGLFQTIGIQHTEIKRPAISKLRIILVTVLASIRFKNRLHELRSRKEEEQRLKRDIKEAKEGIQ